MVTRFDFSTAQRIVFGAGVVQEVGVLAKALGRRPLVVTGRDLSRSTRLIELLGAQGLRAERFSLAGEPTVAEIRCGVARARPCSPTCSRRTGERWIAGIRWSQSSWSWPGS